MKNCHLSTINPSGHFDYSDINHNSRSSCSAPLIVNVAASTYAPGYARCKNKKGRLDTFLIYVLSGVLNVKVGHKVEDISENGLVIIEPNTPYTLMSVKPPLSYLCVHFSGSQVKEKLSLYGLSPFPKFYYLSNKNHLELRFKTLFEAFSKNDELREIELGLLLDRLLIECARGIKNKGNESSCLTKSVRYINEFYTTDIRITDLAQMEGVCMTSYNLAFKAQFGMPPTKYILKLRMEHAAELLSTTQMSVGEIGVTCGYLDINFFSRTFKSFFGVTPSYYRKQAIL